MKRIFVAIISVTILFFNFRVFAAVNAPDISATSAILIEATTGRVIYEKNPDEQRAPASLTKMMTGILALEKLKPYEKTTITPDGQTDFKFFVQKFFILCPYHNAHGRRPDIERLEFSRCPEQFRLSPTS